MKKSGKQGSSNCPHTAMGRKVEYHSPAKWPEQGDEVLSDSEYERLLEEVDKGRQSGTYGGARKDMRPSQRPSSPTARKLQEGLDILMDLDFRKKRK